MVGGISAVNPYAGRYAGYVRPSAALQGARSVDAVSRSAYGQPVQGVRGVGAVTPVSGVAAGREVNGASTVPVPGVSAGQGSSVKILRRHKTAPAINTISATAVNTILFITAPFLPFRIRTV